MSVYQLYYILLFINNTDREHFITLHLAIGLMEHDEKVFRTNFNLPDDIHIPKEIYNEIKVK